MYSPLPHSQCTRVLEILQSTPLEQTRLVIRLTVVDVSTISSLLHRPDSDRWKIDEDDENRFDALSYTWGSPLSTPESEALYGPANDVSITVLVNGKDQYSMMIGRNLYEALLQIYKSSQRRPLWVDAICINQKDLVEKEKHILLMSEIYSKARRVIAWLGKDDPLTDEFRRVTWFHSNVLNDVLDYVRWNEPLQRTDFAFDFQEKCGVYITAMGRYLLPDKDLKVLYKFYAQRRYFSRAWVMQEVALAQNCIALLEDHEISFDRFSTLPRHFDDLGGLASLYAEFSGNYPFIGAELMVLGTNATEIQNWKVSPMTSQLRSLFGAYDDTTSYLAMLEYQLAQGHRRMATDPRDLIYCLLGIIRAVHPGVDDPVKPDYGAAVEDVYIHLTATLLEELPYRSILSHVVDKPLHADYVQRLPSWVPDFVSSTGVASPILLRMTTITQKVSDLYACPEESRFSHLKIKDRTLSLFARRCAKIDFTFRLPSQQASGLLADVSKRTVHAILVIMEVSVKMVQKGMSDLLEPMFRVICWGSVSIERDEDFRILWRRFLASGVIDAPDFSPDDDDPDLAASLERVKELFDSLPGVPSIPSGATFERVKKTVKLFSNGKQFQDEDEVKERMVSIMRGTRALWPEFFSSKPGKNGNIDHEDEEDVDQQEFVDFVTLLMKRVHPIFSELDTFFTTDKGQVGRVCATLQPGDELWLVCQAKVPFVLRPMTPSSTNEYRLIGECFVHDAMRGELIKNGVAEQPVEINIV